MLFAACQPKSSMYAQFNAKLILNIRNIFDFRNNLNITGVILEFIR